MRTEPSRADVFLRICVAVSLVGAPCVGKETAPRLGVVTGDGVTIREGPATSFERVGRLRTGDEITILGEEDGWYRIEGADGRPAWIFAQWVREVLPDSLPTAVMPEAAPPEPRVDLQEASVTDEMAPPPLLPSTEKSGMPWLWIGAGAAAAGVIAVVVLSGGEDRETGSLSFHVVFQ